ncbi:MAG: anthranilate synthase component I family protein, partial [Bacteroidota bacterium]
ELKNVMEPKLHTRHDPRVNFPEVGLFVPEIVIGIERNGQVAEVLHSKEGMEISWETILKIGKSIEGQCGLKSQEVLQFAALTTQTQYLEQVKQLQQHIIEGDCYEVNLAQAFVAEGQLVDPVGSFLKLTALSPVPFASFMRWENLYALCASPERFLQLKEDRLISQPIKGTAPRSHDATIDASYKTHLQSSIKEQAENVMIVDLTRNDLHRSCETGSVQVPYLFEIQAFPQVFQMVSTVEGKKRPDISPYRVLENTFPPGSMTGAPKFRTMEIIDAIEPTARGGYAGSMGYLNPEGGFDFNVIIRTLMYHAERQQLTYHVGGAITYDSDPEAEYEETLVKAKALKAVFG